MTKSELREVQKLCVMHKLGMPACVARGLSALIRSARTKASRADLLEYAPIFAVTNHPDFII